MTELRKSAARWVALGVCAVVFCLAAATADSFRTPEKQATAKLYGLGIQAYRAAVHPISSKWFRCPFYPTCSEYSAQAVKRHGIRKGLRLTIDRLYRCRSTVESRTWDPVPPVRTSR